MQVSTWIDRITGEKNLWLNAVKSEEQNDLPRAFVLFLRDASDCLSRDNVLKAALSCGSAADCLRDLGVMSYARLLYREAASMYLEEAKVVSSSSVREYLWVLRQANRYLLLAGEKSEADEARKSYERIMRKVDPLATDAAILPSVPEGQSSARTGDLEVFVEQSIISQVEAFLQARKEGSYKRTAEDSRLPQERAVARRGTLDEKSIISQLG